MATETNEPGIHNHRRAYGFQACATRWLTPTNGASRNDEIDWIA